MKYFDAFSGYGGRKKATSPPKKELETLHHKEWMTYEEIAKHYKVGKKIVQRWFKENGIVARKAFKRFQSGILNDSWKGDKACYAALHYRIRKLKGTPSKCEVCGTESEEFRYQWANLTGKYEDVEDYKRMCEPCHARYDNKIKNITK